MKTIHSLSVRILWARKVKYLFSTGKLDRAPNRTRIQVAQFCLSFQYRDFWCLETF